MCGIAGIISPYAKDHVRLEAMVSALGHRGPDNAGFYDSQTVSLGHRRLSIIDLSSAANQPMSNEDNSIHLVCNGEIYNHEENAVKMKAKGHLFRSKSDCETLLHIYEEHGTDFLEHVNGMFAFAIWDTRKKRMLIAVDRLGKKPLYYAVVGERLVFASELKALLFFEWLRKDLDHLAIDRYLSLRYVPAPLTIFKSIRKLEQANLMIWQEGNFVINRYWKPKPNENVHGDIKYENMFEELLHEAVKIRLQSDVPLGVYLSAGIDSSTIAGIMKQTDRGRKISYTVGFDYKYDERLQVKKIADYLGYESNFVTVGNDDFDLLPKIAYHLDEPFGDLLCLPAFLLAREAKKRLTVVLTGDGADEILTGYFHQRLMILREKYGAIMKTPGIGAMFSKISGFLPLSLLGIFFDYPDRFGPRERLKLSQSLSVCSEFGSFYEGITSCFTPQDKMKLCAPSFLAKLNHESLAGEYQQLMQSYDGFSFYSRLSLLDLKYWIPFSVIYRLDKMNMAHAVETRSPFLDYRLVENSLNLPDHYKLNRGRNKTVLRSLNKKLYPASLRKQRKQAFYMPITSQYEARFKEWISGLLGQKTIESRGIFQWPYIEELFEMSDRRSMLANRQLTALAMLELWFRVFLDKSEDSLPQ